MATIDFQRYIQLPDGMVIGVHKVTPVSAVAETFSVPPLADPVNAGRSAAQLRRAGDTAATVTTSGINTISVTGTAGVQVTIVSWHNKYTSSHTD